MVKVPAKDEIEYLKEGDDVVKKKTSYQVNASTGALTPTVRKEITSPKGAKSTVVVTPLESSVRYEKDATRAKGESKITVAGIPGTRTVTTTYTVNSTDGSLIPHEGQPVIKSSTSTVVKVPAQDEIEYLKEGDDVVKKTTSYQVNESTGDLTPKETTEIFKRNGAKSTVVVTPLEPSVSYEKDATRAKGEANVAMAGTPGTRTVTTTYTVNPADGSLIPHEEPAVVVSSKPTVVKVPAQDEVEYFKEGDDVVKKKTSYQVNESTGDLTPKETTEIFKRNGAKSTVAVTPLEPSVRYEKDATRAKGEVKITVAGTPGTRTVITTYTVNPTDGSLIPHEEPAVVVPATPTVVKVPAKDKVVETPIEPEAEYVKDVEKDFGTPDERTEGEKGKTVTTTTYDVDPNDGHITEHVGNPVVTLAGTTIVKVGAKTKVEQSKGPEGRDVIDTTTYEVEPKTGKVTSTTVRTYGTMKEPKVELEQDPKTGDVTVTPKKPDGSTYPPGTTVEIPGKGDEPITVTIGEDGKGKVPNSELPEGKVPGTGKITEPGKPAVEVPVENPPKVTIFENGVLPDSIALPELMIEVRWIDEAGNVLKPSVKTGNEKDVEHGSILGYEFVRTVIAENEPVMTHIFSKVSGTTNTTPVTPPKVTIFENGVLPDSIALPELMIEVRWIDEDGNVLKPFVKTGSEKDAEHGSILGYEFVRTVIDENEPVITYIFSKVSGTPTPNPATPPKVTIFENGVLPDSIALPELMIEVRWIDEAGNVLKPSVKTGNEKDVEHGSILGYEFVRTVIAENEPVMTHIFSKVSGTTNTTPVTPPKVTIFENGVLPDSIALPELMIEVRWIDEDGNVLKPFVKTGSEKDAEHGSILGYEFVRTVIDENEPVITYIFSKVSGSTNLNTIPVTPVASDANGNSGHDTPAPTTPIPDAVTPNTDQVDTKTTVDNGAKSNNSQTVLPNTGTESNATLASLGLLGMLGGLGLAFGKKKED